jgi:hypothetical protein
MQLGGGLREVMVALRAASVNLASMRRPMAYAR